MTGTLSFGYPGDGGLGDRLLAAVLRGEKTATSSLAMEYLSGEPLPRVGQRLRLLDHAGRAHGVVETTQVTVVPLHLVGDDVAREEGEGFADAAAWRREHVAFWGEVTELVRADAGDPSWTLRDAEPVVVHRFRLVQPSAGPADQAEGEPAGDRAPVGQVVVASAEGVDGPAGSGQAVLLTPVPLLEDDSGERALFGPLPHDPPVDGFPAAVVACFFSEVVAEVAARPGARLLATLPTFTVWEVEVDGVRVAVYRSGLGSPASVAQLEEVVALGGRFFVAVGGAGALLPELVLGHPVVVTGAVRDEGTSLHYLPPSRTVEADADGLEVLRRTLTEADVAHLVARTWTTDAFYRETRSRADRRVAEGCATVEMEASAFIAAARHRGVGFAQLLYAGDTLAGAEWEHRAWTTSSARPALFELAVRAAAHWSAPPEQTRTLGRP